MSEQLSKPNQEPQKPENLPLSLWVLFFGAIVAGAVWLFPARNGLILSFAAGALAFLLFSLARTRLARPNPGTRGHDDEAVSTNVRLERLNAELNDMAKILVRRDLELTEANRHLQEIDTAKSEFVSVAAHQLRTPLTGIRWSYHTLLEKETGPLTGEQRKLIEEGLKTTLNMVGLINDLLDVARIEEGRYGFSFKRAPLAPILQQSALRIQEPAAEKGIRVVLTLPETPLPLLDIDTERLAIAFDNLLDNAMKYTSPGGTVSLDVSLCEQDVRISVSDTGIGIPKEQLPQIFSKFFRADNALFFQTEGTGLGLYVVKTIIERHNGTVTVESEENKGTSVIVLLPIPKEQTAS